MLCFSLHEQKQFLRCRKIRRPTANFDGVFKREIITIDKQTARHVLSVQKYNIIA